MNESPVERRPGRFPEVLLGAVLLVLTTFVPVLNLVNYIPLAGIVLSGALATWVYIVRHQIRLTYRESFIIGAQSGFTGGVLLLTVLYVLFDRIRGLSAEQFQQLLTDWSGRVTPESAELYQQVMIVVNAPIEVKVISFLVSMVLIGLIFAPIAGLGGRLAVFLLRWHASRSSETP